MRKSRLQSILTKDMLEYNYKLHGSMQKIANALDISVDSIYKYMKLFNIEYAPHYVGVYDCRHDIFIEDNEASFYLAGFIAADGSLQFREHSKILKITLSKKDLQHLVNLRSLLQSNHPIKCYRVKPSKLVKTSNMCAELQMASHSICNDLARFNIVPNKTLVYSMPEWLIEHPLVYHFMRGYLDGDGTFSHCGLGPKRTVRQASFSMIGTEKFVEQYRDVLVRNCNVSSNKIVPKNTIYGVSYTGNNVVRRIAEFLYKDATIYLERKLDRVRHLLTK